MARHSTQILIMTRIQITVLGGLEIRLVGSNAPLSFPTRKSRALVAYLAMSPGMTRSREHLAGILWGRSAEEQARASLRQTLSSLRKVLTIDGNSIIGGDADTISLDARFTEVDALDFERRLTNHSIESLQDAVAIYSGDFLDGFSINEESYESWLAMDRRRLQELAVQAFSDLLTHYARTRSVDLGVRVAERLLAIDPLQEWAHCALMRLYSSMGRREAALRQYRECARILEGELGISPAAETEALAKEVARGHAEVASPDRIGSASSGEDDDDRPLAVTSPADESSVEPPPVLPAERKQVTVLCARVRQPVDDADPETTLGQLDPALEAMADAIRQFGGTISHIRSDGITALFGAPRADEDHAQRACYVALAMRDAIGPAGDSMQDVRIGIHSGEAVVRTIGDARSRHYDAVGPVAQIANAIDAALEPGSIGITGETRKRAEGFVELSAVQEASVEGVSAPIELFMLQGRSSLRLRWEARAGRELTPFVGRQGEMLLLADLLERAAGGAGQAATVVGEPGVGKSRLVHQLVNSPLVRGWTVFETGATSLDTNATYAPVSALLQTWFAIDERDATDVATEKACSGVEALDRAMIPLLPPLLALLDLPVLEPDWCASSPAQKRRRTLEAVKTLVLHQSQLQPVLVVVEDLHWIDSGTQAVLDHLVESVGAARILLLFTHRPEYRHMWLGWSYFSQLRVDPLGRAQADRLLGDLVGDDPGLIPLRQQLIEHTGGTPLFLEESVRTLTETGTLAGKLGAYRLTQPLAEFRIPSTVQAVLAARIDRLPARAKNLLQIAAVVGNDIPAELLQPLADIDVDDFGDTLADLQAAEFLYQTRLLPKPEYTFKHALTHQVAYESLLKGHRRTAHRRLVEIMEKLYAGRLNEHAERLAYHAVRGEQWDKAVHYLHRSAGRAMQRSAHQKAIDHLLAGLRLIRSLPEPREQLRLELDYQKALGVALMAAKGWAAPEVLEAYVRAQELCEELVDKHELFIALRGEGQYRMIRGESDIARRLGDRCAELGRDSTDMGVAIETHHLCWTNGFFMGDYASANQHCSRGIELYDVERDHELTYLYSGHDPGVCCRCFSALIQCLRGYPDQSLQRCREALELANQLDHPLTTALAYWALAYVHLFRREALQAGEWARKTIALCEEYLLPLLHSHGVFQAGWAQAELGNLEEGITRMREGLAANSATGAEMGSPYFAALLAEALGRAGECDQGLDEIDRALTVANENGARFQVSEMLRLKGELLIRNATPRMDEAEECLRQSLEAAVSQDAKLPGLGSALSLARLLKRNGNAAEARSILRPAYEAIREGRDLADMEQARLMLETLGE
jgi:DNA-binding SARP family transcriptional activator/predicted ATPase